MTVFNILSLLLLFLPGFSFRRGLLSNEFSLGHKFTNLFNEIILSFLVAVVLHFIFIELIVGITHLFSLHNWLFSDLPKSFNEVKIPINQDGSYYSKFHRGIFWPLKAYVIYIFFLTIISYFLGMLSAFLIILSRADTQFPFFRFDNHYSYALSQRVSYREWKRRFRKGIAVSIHLHEQKIQSLNEKLKKLNKNKHQEERQNIENEISFQSREKNMKTMILDEFNNDQKFRHYIIHNEKKITVKMVDLLVQLDGKEIIYKGRYVPFKNKDGELDSIKLSYVRRQEFDPTGKPTEEHKIQGHEMVFKFDTIKNFNMRVIITFPFQRI